MCKSKNRGSQTLRKSEGREHLIPTGITSRPETALEMMNKYTRKIGEI